MIAKKDLILIGGGGHCKSCMEVINAVGNYNIKGILDMPSEIGKEVLEVKIIGTDEDIKQYHEQDCSFFITLGQIKSAAIRMRIFEQLVSIGADIVSIIAPTAYVSRFANIGAGTIIMHQAFVNAGAEVGDNNIINTGAVLEHDVQVGNHNHISTGVYVNGDCVIGNENFIGSGTVLANGITLQQQIVVAAGSVLYRSIDKEGTYMGSPLRKIK